METTHPRFQPIYKRILFFVLTLVPLSGAAVDIYAPSLPAIQHHFSTLKSTVQLSISVYIIAYGVFQLLFGTLADHYGRKKFIVTGCALFCISSFFAGLSPTIGMLLFLRAVQGFAIAMMLAPARIILVDVFKPGISYHTATTYMTLCWALGPVIAPFIGGNLQHYINWRAPLFFLSAYSLIMFIYACRIPPTKTALHPLNLKILLNNYKRLISCRNFWGFLLLLLFGYSFVTVFNVIGPFIIEGTLGKTPQFFGNGALILGVGMLLGNILSRMMIKKSMIKRLWTGTMLILVVAILSFILSIMLPVNAWLVFASMWFIFFCSGLIFPIGFAGALGAMPDIAGSASAIAGTLFVLGGGICSALATSVHAKTMLPLASINLIIAILMLACIIILIRIKAPTKKTT